MFYAKKSLLTYNSNNFIKVPITIEYENDWYSLRIRFEMEKQLYQVAECQRGSKLYQQDPHKARRGRQA